MNKKQRAVVGQIIDDAAEKISLILPMADFDMFTVSWSVFLNHKESNGAVLTYAMPKKIVKALGGKLKAAGAVRQALRDSVK